MRRDEIVAFVEEKAPDADIILFDGLEAAFVGIAERFEPDGHHRVFAVYDYERMVEDLVADGSDYDEAVEYIDFNVIGLYAGETTPAILYRHERES